MADGDFGTAVAQRIKQRALAGHTHTADKITDLTEAVQDIVGALLVAGVGTTVTYDDAAGTVTINATGGGGGETDPEIVRDVIGGALVAGAGIQITVNDAGDSITIASTAVLTDDPRLTDARTPTAHKSTHATGGTDALTPADIGAQPAGSYAPALGTDENYVTDAEKARVAGLGAVTATGADAAAARTAIGLGTAATQASTAFATSAQGAKADTAVQPAGLPTWTTISGKPTVVAAGADAAAARASISVVGRGELTLSALDYGAATTNTAAANATALQAGLDAAGNAGKARFLIPPGAYPVGAALTQRPGTTIDGWGATLNATHGSNVIQATGVQGTPLDDLSVVGLKIIAIETLSNGRGISYQYVKNAKIHGVTITRPGNNGLDIRESSDVMVSQSDITADDYGIFMYRCKDFVITGNTIHDVLNGIDVKGSMNASTDEKINGTIIGNTFRRYKDHGVTGAGLAEEGFVRGLTINGNTFRDWRTDTENTTGSAIESGTMAIGWAAIGNVLSDPGSHGISIFGRDHSFLGNFIEWKNVAPVAAPAIGMTTGSTAMGNVIKGCYDGIYAAAISDVTILGNSIAAPVRYGIWIRNDTAGGACSNVKVAFNGISGGTRGLYEQGTGGVGNQVFHNSVTGSTTANYTLISPATWRGMNSGQTPPAVTGAKGSNAALASLLTQLAAAGIITDSTTA